MISPEKIEEVKNANDIVDVVGEHLELKKSGSNFKANCPFHQEKTPSFMVSPEKQIFHCFGCGVGGNVFTFMQKQENVSFVESVKLLARKVGIVIEETGFQKSNFDEKEKIFTINKDGLKFFKEELKKNEAAMEYVKKRNLDGVIAEEFEIGYAPSGNGLYKYLKEKGHKDEFIEKSWLCKKSDNGFYDIFRNRLIFPILDTYGDPVAFGARVLDDSLPKYINSKETTAYIKGKNLYNLNNAKKAKKDSIVIVEGYMDAIALYKKNIKNVSASLGTALTIDQARLLKRFVNRVFLAYDMDDAGTQGALRGGEHLFTLGMDAYVVRFEGAKDPDEYIEKFGAEKLIGEFKKAIPFFDFKIQMVKEKGDINNAYFKEQAIKELAAVVEKTDNFIVKNECIKKISEQLNVSADVLNKYVKTNTSYKKAETESILDEYSSSKDKGRELAEKIVLSIVLNGFSKDDESIIVGHVFNKMKLMDVAYGDFKNQLYAGILEKAEKLFSENRNTVLQKIELAYIENEEAVRLISELLSRDGKKSDDNKNESKVRDTESINQITDDCLTRMTREKHYARMYELQVMIREAEKENDFEKLKGLLKQKQEVQNIIDQRGEEIG